jgi:hypothetical protein
MVLTDVAWPGPGGAVILTGSVEHGTLRGDGDLVLLNSDGEIKKPVIRAVPASPAARSRPGQLRPWPQRPGFFTLYVWGTDRHVPVPTDLLVRLSPWKEGEGTDNPHPLGDCAYANRPEDRNSPS